MPLLDAVMYSISPEYFRAAGTALLAGRTLHMARRQRMRRAWP